MNTRAIRCPPKKFWPKDSNRIWLEKLYYKFKTEVIWNPLLYKADTSQKVCFSKASIRIFFNSFQYFFVLFTKSIAMFVPVPWHWLNLSLLSTHHLQRCMSMQFVNYTTVFKWPYFPCLCQQLFLWQRVKSLNDLTEQIKQVDEGTYIYNKTISLLMWPYLSTVTFF